MSAPKHTAGPWKVRGSYEGSVTILALREHTDAHGKTSAFFAEIAKTAPVGNEGARKANARLIAAAPDLLEALVLARDHMVSEGSAIAEICDAAIAKATGAAQ